MTPEFRVLLDALAEHQVAFVVVGGVALVLHGSPRATQDLDICYARDEENLRRLSEALKPFAPTLRGAPPGLPFKFDPPTINSGLNFTLSTSAGDLDLLGEVLGVGQYREASGHVVEVMLYGHRVLILDLDALENAKRAAGRLKDLLDLAEISEIRKRTPR
jgi:hypothetical protein